jgi:hypothetical protein
MTANCTNVLSAQGLGQVSKTVSRNTVRTVWFLVHIFLRQNFDTGGFTTMWETSLAWVTRLTFNGKIAD